MTARNEDKDLPPERNPGTQLSIVDRYLPAAAAAIFLALGDLATNDTAATVLKINGAVKRLFPEFGSGGYVALVIMIAGALFLAWLRNPKNKTESFALGMSVFTALIVISPYKELRKEAEAQQQPQPSASKRVAEADFSIISEAYAQDGADPAYKYVVSASNASIRKDVGVSSCKPYYEGPLGLSSWINNRVGFCDEPYELKSGMRAQVLECWDTGFRNYRYVKLGYEIASKSKTGWVPDGRVPDVWIYVHPDKINSMPQNCGVGQ